MINFNQIRAFHNVAKCLSFSIAAENLCVSQPAVTAQIKLLEDCYKVKLFLRKGRKLYLTDEGKAILGYTTKIFDLEKDLENCIYDIQKLKQGSIRIGTTKTYARVWMPTLLVPFLRSLPGIIVELIEGSSQEISQNLFDFKCSLAIIPKIKNNPNLNFIPLAKEEIVLLAAPNHYLNCKEQICPDDLVGESIVMKEVGSVTRKMVEETFGEKIEKMNIIAETSNMEFIKELVRQGEGISFLVKSAIQKEIAKGILVTIPIKNVELLMTIYLVHLSDYYLSAAAKAFLDFLDPIIRLANPIRGIDAFLNEILGKYAITEKKGYCKTEHLLTSTKT